MDQMDFEWVERPCSRNSEHSNTHEDDMDSLGVISLEDSASEGCGTPSAAAAAVITALEDAGPFEQLQDIINEAMASFQCVGPSPAAVQQQEVVESEATCDSPMSPSLQTPCAGAAHAASSAASAAAAHQGSPDSSEETPMSPDNPHPSDRATACSTSTRTALLLLFGACAAAAIATLVLVLVRPAAFTFANTPTETFAARDALLISSQYRRYTATRVAVPMQLNYTRTAAVPPATASSNAFADAAKQAAAASRPQGVPQPPSAPVNMMLSCPKEWQCRYPKPQLAPWLAGTAKTNTAYRMPVGPAVTASGCQATAAAVAAGAQCPRKATNMSAAHRLCASLWSYHASQPAAAATAAADTAALPGKPAVQCTVMENLQLQQQQVPVVRQPQPASNITNSSSSCTGKRSSKVPWVQAAAGLLAAAADHAAKAASAAFNSTHRWTDLPTNTRPPPPTTAATTPVWRIARPTKTVPALHLPAPPCFTLAKPGSSSKQRMPRSSVQARSVGATLCRTAAAAATLSSSISISSKALDFAAIKKLVYTAASFGSGLTLPMLPPTVYAQPGSVSNSSSSSIYKRNVSDNKINGEPSSARSEPDLMHRQPGLTLPMLPPVKGHRAVTGGLTLPMLPPVMCSTCGSSLQLLPTPSSSRIAAVVAARPTLSPADQQPTCPMSSPRTCTAIQQQHKLQYKLQYSQRYMLPQQQPKEKQRGTSAASCKSSSGGVLLVHMPPAVTAVASQPQPSSSSGAASVIKQHLGLAQDSGKAASCDITNHTLAPKTNSTASGQAAFITSNSSSSSSASVGAVASGSWVATWVSFPTLLPVEHVAAINLGSKHPQQQQRPDAVELSSPWAAMSSYKAYPRKQRAAASSTNTIKRSSAASKKVSFTRAAAPAPYRPIRGFKARPAVQSGYKPPSTAANIASAAAAAAGARSLRTWAARVNTNAAALLQPAQTIMQIASTARSRSLQCTIPAADHTSGSAFGDGASGAAGRPSNSTGGSFGGSAFAANSAACAASRQLFSAALALEKASWHAAHTAAPAPAKQQRMLQSLCAAVGHAHRELQARLATAVFKQHDVAGTNSAAALFSRATATATATRHPATYIKNTAAAATARAPFAIPLGPVGGVELRSAGKRHYNTPASAPHSFVKSIAAPGSLQGPLLPLKQQRSAQTRATVPATMRPAYAPARATGVAYTHAYASSSSRGSVWMLNLGWEQRSAWAAAKVAAQLGKAEASLQAACQHLLGAAAA